MSGATRGDVVTAAASVAARAAAARAAAGVVSDLDRVLGLALDEVDEATAAALVPGMTAMFARDGGGGAGGRRGQSRPTPSAT
jgi:hypothetical protein